MLAEAALQAAGGGSQSLAAREAALKKREAEVARREAQLQRNAAGFNPMLVKNWPRCYPIVHHDISGDIPERKARHHARVRYSSLQHTKPRCFMAIRVIGHASSASPAAWNRTLDCTCIA